MTAGGGSWGSALFPVNNLSFSEISPSLGVSPELSPLILFLSDHTKNGPSHSAEETPLRSAHDSDWLIEKE